MLPLLLTSNPRLDPVPYLFEISKRKQRTGSVFELTQAIAALLKTGHNEPHMPNEARPTTGKLIWYVAPIRPVIQMKTADIVYPIQTHSQDCHHDSPPIIMEDDIIQVF